MSHNKKRAHVIHGPNLNMLGRREPEIYGSTTLEMVNGSLKKDAQVLNIELEIFQSNHEGKMVDKIHELFEAKTDGIVINPGAFTHTSVALRDALLLLQCPIIEVHISNIYKREAFRHKSMLADIVTGQISGLGTFGYNLALKSLANMINES